MTVSPEDDMEMHQLIIGTALCTRGKQWFTELMGKRKMACRGAAGWRTRCVLENADGQFKRKSQQSTVSSVYGKGHFG